MKLSRFASFVVATILCAAVSSAAQNASPAGAPLPSGRDVVNRHVQAIGGEAALAAVRSMRIRGRLEIPAQKIAGDLEILTARPARMLYRVTVPGVGRIENGYDGTIGWSVSPLAGPELLSGRQLREVADDAWFDAPLRPASRVKELVTIGRTEFDGRPAYKVRVVFRSGTEQFEYYDEVTGLQIGTEAERAMPQGVVQAIGVHRDYRRFGGLLHAATQVQRALGFEQVLTITSCEYDVVSDSAFEPPAEVKALTLR